MSDVAQATLPVDWKIQKLAELGIPVRGGSPRPAGDPRFFNGSYIPWLTVASLTGIPDAQLTVSETATHLTQEGSLRSRTLNPGTLIVANSGATLGVAKILGVQCCANDGIAALLNPVPGVDVRYLAYFINTQTKLLRDVVATGNGQPNLNTGLIGAINIPIPSSIDEQREIADTLSDVDALIRGLDQLIAKKRDIQQATMQQLLTGQRRLPGFSLEWQKLLLGELAFFLKGSSLSKMDLTPDGARKCILYGELFTTYGRVIHSVYCKTNSSNGTPSVAGDVLLPGSTTTTGIDLANASAVLEDGVLLGGDINIIRPRQRDSFNPEFLAHYLTSVAAKDIAERAQGITIIHLYGRDLRSLSVILPPEEEQAAIASILSDMNAEIATLEARRDKICQLKTGMMQELMTGRIRMA